MNHTRPITAQDYLEHTKSVMQALFKAISEEKNRLAKIQPILSQQTAIAQEGFLASELSEDLGEQDVQYKYGLAMEARMQKELVLMSLEILSGSVLQIAKQGISIKFGKSELSKGRVISGMQISNVIWHGRNQALHWEEGKPRQEIKDCFDALKNNVGVQFDLNGLPKNKAWEVIRTLDWDDYEKYEQDMREIFKVKK